MTAHLDAFLRLDHKAAELAAQTLRPLVTRTADRNFVETMRFVSLFSRTVETNPSGAERLATNLPRTDEATRREFARVCREASGRCAERRLASRRRAAVVPVSGVVRR